MQIFSAGTIAMTATTHGSGGVAFAAHVVGFVTGLVGVFVFRKRERDRWDRRTTTAGRSGASRVEIAKLGSESVAATCNIPAQHP